ncbi:MAG: hypothetical protein IJA86_08675 [Clostridia bacterium]|nr:hypothetical protein [Clostridia bacterium]
MSYSVALALQDGETMVFLCFSRFQHADGMEVADQFRETFGDDLLNFLIGFKRRLFSSEYSDFRARFSDENLLAFMREELIFENREICSLVTVFEPLFNRLQGAVATLGYHISAKIDPAFLQYLFVRVSVHNLLFLFGKLVYLIMKFSNTKQVEIELFSEIAYSRHTVRFMTETALTELPETQGNKIVLLEKLMPEYATEIVLLDKMGLMKDSDFSIYIDAFGRMVITYSIDYFEPEWNVLQSVDVNDISFFGHIENMIHVIKEKLTEMCASC